MEKTVFISHSHVDASVAVLLRDALEKNGIGCWICSRDIDGGESWAEEIVAAIESCRVFLFLLSENSAASKQCHKEIALADAANCSMVCVNIDRSELRGAAKYHFYALQTMFVDRVNLVNELDGVIGRIRGFVKGKGGGESGIGVPSYDFSFRLDLKGKCVPFRGAQKARLIEIITDRDRDFHLSITLEDDNVEALERQILQTKKKLEEDLEVSDEELHYMTLARTVVNRQKKENLRKAMAAKLFLHDYSTQALCGVRSLSDVCEVLENLFTYQPRFDAQEKMRAFQYTMLEFVLPGTDLWFSAPVRNEIVEERRRALGYFCEIGLLPSADLGTQYLREILTYFYMFQAEKLEEGNETVLQDRARDLLRYNFGLK